MAAFEDWLNSFSYNPDTFNEEEFKNAARAKFGEDEEHYKAEITERDGKITELDNKTSEMGKALWDAQMRVGPKVKNDPADTTTSSGGDGDQEPKDIKSFFKKVER